MSIMYGNDKITNFPWANEEIARAYWGNDLIYENKPWYSEYGVLADYVISNGFDNWIDTFIGTQPDLIIEMGITYLESGREQSAFGAYDLNKVVIEAGSVTSGGNAFYAYDDDRTWDVRAFDVEYNKHYNLKYNFQNGLQVVYIDDVEVHRTTNTSGALVGLSMVLFARNYGTSSSAARQNYMNAKWTHFKLSKSDGTILADYKPFYISKKPMVDWKNRTHEVGVYTMIDMVRRKAVPLYGEPLEGSYTPWWSKYGSATPYAITNGINNYIDTGVMTQTDLNIELDVEYLKVDGTSEHLFGGVNGTSFNRRIIELGFINAGKLTYAYGYSWTNTNFVPQQDTPYKIRGEFTNGSQIMRVNGEEEFTTGNTTEFDNNPISMHLFTRNEFGTPASNMATVKFKACKVDKPSGEVLIDYEPICLDKQEMIDDNGRVYSVGSFVIVDNVTEKVTKLYGDDLKGLWWQKYGNRVEYIEGDGTAYIDIGYMPQYENGRTELGVTIVNVDSATSIYGFIERSGDLANRIAIGSTASGLFTGSGNTNYMVSPTQANFKYEIDWDRKTGKTILNGVEYDTPNLGGLTKTYSAYLFSRNDNGKPDANGVYNLAGKVYYLRETLDDVVQLSLVSIQVRETFISKNNVSYSRGDFIMINELVELDVPTHVGKFTGENTLPLPYKLINGITFDSNENSPTIKLGAWKDYNKISLTFSSDDTSDKDLFFGWFDETGMFEWNNGLMGYDGDTFVVNSEITNDPYTVTPNLTPTEKGDGTDKTIVIEYTSTSGELVSFGANADETYTKKKNAKSLTLENTINGTIISLLPVILQEEYQEYAIGSVGFIDEATEKFYGSNDPNYNFIAVE